jgi:transposase-like protein
MSSQPPQLATWQATRRETLRQQAIAAIRRMDRDGESITYAGVARSAGVDRSWLYTQSDLASEIQRLRHETRGPLRPRPRHERASDASLKTRLHASLKLVSELTAQLEAARIENEQLRSRIDHFDFDDS